MKLTTIHENSPRGVFFKAALDDLKEYGIDKLSPHRIEAKTGVKDLYDDSEQLLTDLIVLGFDELTSRLEKLYIMYPSFEQRLYHMCEVYLELAFTHSNLINIMFNYKQQFHSLPPAHVKEAGDQTFEGIKRIMSAAIMQDLLKSKDSQKAALASWSYLHGSAMQIQRHTKESKASVETIKGIYGKLYSLLSKGLVSNSSH
ncbi:MAG: TetR/AcrR family transcriptional regulator [Pseudobacteriovorax sp.]|nr:TetR/AcrR family transcriptional regulator [Pseudobacteriovorax sp.]